MARLGFDLGFRDVHFHMQRDADAATKSLGLITRQEKILIQRGNVGEPGIAQRNAIDDVKMGVDDGRKGHVMNRGNEARRRMIITSGESRQSNRLKGAVARWRIM